MIFDEDTEARELHKLRDDQAALFKSALGGKIPFNGREVELAKVMGHVRAGEVLPFKKTTPAAPAQRPRPVTPAVPMRPAAVSATPHLDATVDAFAKARGLGVISPAFRDAVRKRFCVLQDTLGHRLDRRGEDLNKAITEQLRVDKLQKLVRRA
jgi:hypothetical protein